MRPYERPRAALVDMDGTLVNVSSILHYVQRPSNQKDFRSFHDESLHCPANKQALDFCVRHHEMGHVIVVGSARMQQHYEVSSLWLERNMVTPYDGPILMRRDGERIQDVFIKRRMFRYLSRNYDIVAAIDDNPPIVALWKELGIPEVEVVPGWVDNPHEKNKQYTYLKG